MNSNVIIHGIYEKYIIFSTNNMLWASICTKTYNVYYRTNYNEDFIYEDLSVLEEDELFQMNIVQKDNINLFAIAFVQKIIKNKNVNLGIYNIDILPECMYNTVKSKNEDIS